MILRLIAPAKALAPYIKTYWYLRAYSKKEVHQTIVPNGKMGLCFYRSGALDYIGMGKYQAGLGGQRLKSLVMRSCGVEALGVEFYPYGVRRFFPIPAREFFHQVCTPQEMADEELIKLEDDIISAPDASGCWALLNKFFMSRLVEVDADELNFSRIKASLDFAYFNSAVSVEAMADAANLSQKQFRRIFSDYVGVMPKGYLRLQRHQKVMERLLLMSSKQTEMQTLEEISANCGYYSSAHLITDFKDIMGYNPSDVLNHHSPESYSWVDVQTTSEMNK